MKHSLTKLTIILVIICSSAFFSNALAQQWAELHNSNPANLATYIAFKEYGALEELSAFLSPLRLPRRLTIKMRECRTVNIFYEHYEGIIICYEFPRYLWRVASQISVSKGLTRRDVFVGTFVQATLHEVGHAVFDMLGVPILGREEDAADQIAALVMLNFGKEFARRNLNGVARFFRTMNMPMSRTAFSDEHGAVAQRFYNLLCIAYGGQPATFKNTIDAGILPKERASRCDHEYEQVKYAFAETIMPHVDQGLLKKVQSIEWAKWDGSVIDVNEQVRNKFFLILVTVSLVIVALLARNMGSSPKEMIREMAAFGWRSVKGRFDRIHWWTYMLSASLVASVLSYALASFEVDFTSPYSLRLLHDILGWAIALLLYYWYMIFVIKRLHDRNRRAWAVVFWLAPWVLSSLLGAYPDFGANPFFVYVYGLSFFVWIWIFIETGFFRGTRGTNRYGAALQYGTPPQIPYSKSEADQKAFDTPHTAKQILPQQPKPISRLSVAWLVAAPLIIIVFMMFALFVYSTVF